MSTFVLDGRYIQDHFPGIGRYAFNLAEALARVAPDESFRIIHDPRLVNTRYDLDLLARRPNVELTRVAAPTFSLREQWLGARRALTRDAALWHSAYYVMPYLLPLSVVVTLGDVMPLVRPSEMPGAARRLVYRVLNALAARAARTVITFSRAARDGLERALGIPAGKIVVVPLAADARFGAASTREISSVRDRLDLPEAYALYLGANKPHKNLGRLIRAWARVGRGRGCRRRGAAVRSTGRGRARGRARVRARRRRFARQPAGAGSGAGASIFVGAHRARDALRLSGLPLAAQVLPAIGLGRREQRPVGEDAPERLQLRLTGPERELDLAALDHRTEHGHRDLEAVVGAT